MIIKGLEMIPTLLQPGRINFTDLLEPQNTQNHKPGIENQEDNIIKTLITMVNLHPTSKTKPRCQIMTIK